LKRCFVLDSILGIPNYVDFYESHKCKNMHIHCTHFFPLVHNVPVHNIHEKPSILQNVYLNYYSINVVSPSYRFNANNDIEYWKLNREKKEHTHWESGSQKLSEAHS
jgi:hypothetical protein